MIMMLIIMMIECSIIFVIDRMGVVLNIEIGKGWDGCDNPQYSCG